MEAATAAALDRIEKRLRDVLADVQALRGVRVQDPAMERFILLLEAIVAVGGRLPKAEIRRIAVSLGYDARGVGGFYRGNGSLRSVGKDEAEITTVGRQLLADHDAQIESSVRT